MTQDEIARMRKRTAQFARTAQSAMGLSSDDFARRLGMKYATYKRIVTAQIMPDVRKLMRIEQASGVRLDMVDARIKTGITFMRDAARALEGGATIYGISRRMRCADETLSRCIRFARELDGVEEVSGYAPNLQTVIKFAERIAAMREDEIAEMYGACSVEEVGARSWMLSNFGPDIAATMRDIGGGKFEFDFGGTYIARIEAHGRDAQFRAFFVKDGNERMSTERRIRI